MPPQTTPVRQPTFVDVAVTPEATGKRQANFRSLGADELALRLVAAEDELTAHRLQTAKRLSLHLNKRLMKFIEDWKTVQSKLAVLGPGDEAHAEKLRGKAASLAMSITEQRRIVEEALQLMITLQPEGNVVTTPTMSLTAKARFQGTPVATLKSVPISQGWLATLTEGQDPNIQTGSGPAQQWRFRVPAVEVADGTRPRSPSRSHSLGLVSEEIDLAFKRFDTDNDGRIDVSELEEALKHLGVDTLPSGKFHQDAANILARYDPEGKGLGSGKLGPVEFNALCVDALQAQHDGPAGDDKVPQLKVGEKGASELILEAVDADGRVDTDFYGNVLVELDTSAAEAASTLIDGHVTPSHGSSLGASADGTLTTPRGAAFSAARYKGLSRVEGLGFIQISAGVGRTTISSTQVGFVFLTLEDGALSEPALSTLAKPPPFRIEFVSGRAVRTRVVACVSEATVGDEVELSVLVVDEHLNCVPSVISGEVVLEEASGRAVSGLGKLMLVNGRASTSISTAVAGDIVLTVSSVDGFPDAVTMMASKQAKPLPGAPSRPSTKTLSGSAGDAAFASLRLRFLPGRPKEASIMTAPTAELVAGRGVALEVHVRDGWGNLLEDAALYAHLRLTAITIEGGKSVERAYDIVHVDSALPPLKSTSSSATSSDATRDGLVMRRFLATVQTESASLPICCWLSVHDDPKVGLTLKHRQHDPCYIEIGPSEATQYCVSRVTELIPEGDVDLLQKAAADKEQAAVELASAKEIAQQDAAQKAARAAEAVMSLEVKQRAEEGVISKLALLREEGHLADSVAAQAEQIAQQAANVAAERAAEATAASDKAEALKQAVQAAVAEVEAAAAAVRAAAAEEVEMTKLAAESGEVAEAALFAAWEAKEAASTAASDAVSQKERADAAAAVEPLGVQLPMKMVVTAKDRFGNAVGASTLGKVEDVSLEVRGPVRLALTGKDKVPKLALVDGVAEFDVLWCEDAKLPGPQASSDKGVLPRPIRANGKGSALVIAKPAKGSGSEVEIFFRHSVPARAVLGARPWSGEGPDQLEALAGKPLMVPVMVVDQFGCVCSNEDPRTIRVRVCGQTSGVESLEAVRCEAGVGLLTVSRTLAESVDFAIADEDRVISNEESEGLSSRVADGKMPLLKFFTDTSTVAFRHANACAIQVLLLPEALATKPATSSSSASASQLPPIGTSLSAPPSDLASSSQSVPELATGEHVVAAMDGGPANERSDGGRDEKAGEADGKAGKAVEDRAPGLHVVAGSRLCGIVQAVDAFGNPATSAVWWKGKSDVSVVLEEEALPFAEESTLSGRLPKEAGSASLLPVTNGSVKHSVSATSGGQLKRKETRKLDNGQVKLAIDATIAGELTLRAELKDEGKAGPGKLVLAPGSCSAHVTAAAAEMFDLVPLDQTTGGMRVMVHARDAYGNLDEDCDREVLIELDKPGSERFCFDLPGDGIVKLTRGVAEVTGIRQRAPKEDE